MEKETKQERQPPKNWQEYFSFGETSRVFRWVWRDLIGKDSRKWARKMCLFLILATIIASITPVFVAKIFDSFESSVSLNQKEVWIFLFWFLIFSIIEKFFNFLQSKAREWQLGLNQGTLDQRITELFFEKSPGQHINEKSILNSANLEKGRARVINLQNMLLFDGIPATFTLFASLIFLLFFWPVAGIGMIIVASLHLLWTLYLNRQVLEKCEPIERGFRRLNRYRHERWEKVIKVKTVGSEERELDYMQKTFDEVMSRDRIFWFWFLRHVTFRDIMNIFGAVCIFGYGLYLVMYEGMSFGMLYPLFIWTMRVRDNLWRLGSIEHQINWNMPAIKHMMEALTMSPDMSDTPGSITLKKEPVQIEFRNVSHSYKKKNFEGVVRETNDAIKNISFKLGVGEKIGLVGASGSGKSTIAKLLLRYMDPTEGQILVNGIPLTEVKRNSWMEVIGHIPQRPEIFDGTIKYNLLYSLSGGDPVAEEELKKTVDMLQIDFADGIDGLETKVGYDGIELSGGQNQRLAAGSAIMSKPNFLVVDEASSSLDSTTEKAFQAGLDLILSGNQSALIIAHRLSTLKNCDRIIVLRSKNDPKNEIFGTQIDAEGRTFAELYEKSEIFRQLAEDQDLKIENKLVV